MNSFIKFLTIILVNISLANIVTAQTDINDLIRKLQSAANYKDRAAAAEELGRLKDDKALDPLITALLKDQYINVREKAAEALGLIGDPKAIKPLIASLYMYPFLDRWAVMREAVEALVKIGEQAKAPLISALKSERPTFKFGIAKTLEMMGWKPATKEEDIAYLAGTVQFAALEKHGAASISTLVAYLHEEMIPSDHRYAAAQTIEKLGYKPPNESELNIYLVAGRKWDELIKMGKPEPLIAAMKLGENTVDALVKMGSKVVNALLVTLKDENPYFRGRAAWILGEIKDKRAILPLIALLTDQEERVRLFAIQALIKLESEDKLVEKLNTKGSEDMAESFLYFNNPKLIQAAKDWASKNGYRILSILEFSATADPLLAEGIELKPGSRLRLVR